MDAELLGGLCTIPVNTFQNVNNIVALERPDRLFEGYNRS